MKWCVRTICLWDPLSVLCARVVVKLASSMAVGNSLRQGFEGVGARLIGEGFEVDLKHH